MTHDTLKRLSLVAGGAVFVLALLVQLPHAEPGQALMLALGAGVGLGLAGYLVGSIMSLAREPGAAAEPSPAAPDPEKTTALSSGEVAKAAGFEQTVRLEAGKVDYLLPEISPEELFREREGINEAFLRQGIEGAGSLSENTMESKGEGGK
jgi:hypothetical protein